MIVKFPNSFDRTTMYELIRQVINEDFEPKSKEITFDFGTLGFIEPVGVTVLSNLIEWLKKRGAVARARYSSHCKKYQKKWCSSCYLDDSLFFERYTGKKRYSVSSPRSTTIPLAIVAYKESYQWLETTIQWLSYNLNMSKESLENIKVCFQEIFNNINDHTGEKIGCVFAQHYPAYNEVRVAISDFGVGIPYNVRKVLPNLTDGEAILKATEYGFTTRSNPQNGGRGLDTLIHYVVKNNKGLVYIHSNHGILEGKSGDDDGDDILLTISETNDLYPGTLLDIVFKTDTIEIIEEEEFEWL